MSGADPCVYIYQGENPNDFLVMAIYVDDFFVFDNNEKLRDQIVAEMLTLLQSQRQ